MHMKPNQLRALLAVADEGSIRRAAKALFVSQPSITRLVKELEKDLGVDLVTRSTTGVSLTVYGNALIKRARLLAEEHRRAREEIEQIRTGSTGSVRIAVSALAALTILPRAFARFRRLMPGVELHCADGLPPVALPSLQSGYLDFVLADVMEAVAPHELECELLLTTRQVVVLRSEHPQRRSRSLQALRNNEWITWDQEQLRKVFERNGVAPPDKVIQIESFVAAVGIVEETDAVSLFSAATMRRQFGGYGVRTVNVADKLPPAVVSAVTRRESILTPAAATLLEQLRQVAGEVSRGSG